ncbi:MAG TPA: hypothetical protein VFG53_11325 [Anaeromyxobacter sp.]|nr:hypothetical protein [Anaeromyxobacter sp.]
MATPTTHVMNVITRELSPHIGETTARAAATVHLRRLGIDARVMTAAQLESLLERIGAGLNVFVGKQRSTEIMESVRDALAGGGEA